jgi:AraC-like DNA-binding protein
VFSLGGGYHKTDGKTRVFDYNGRKLVSILGREDFPGERVFKLPVNVVEFAARQPLTSALLPCRIGYSPNARGQKVTRPSGDWAFTLLFCLDGAGMLHLDRSQHRMTQGMFALLRPFEYHSYEADDKTPWSYYWIHFNGTQAQQWYDVLTASGKRVCIELRPDMHFIESFEKILNIYHDGHAYKMLVRASAALHQMFGDLYGLICGIVGEQETVNARVERTIELMRNNPGLHVSIQELAGLANMSHAYYSLQFREHTGESPRSYFNKLKIKKACEYLASTNAKVENIANLIGFDDPFYFCRLFKRVTGKTPSEYRTSAQKPKP